MGVCQATVAAHSVRKTKQSDHHKHRNERKKTRSQAIHVVNPPGSKTALRLLKRRFPKEVAKLIVRGLPLNPGISLTERTPVEGLPSLTLPAEPATQENL